MAKIMGPINNQHVSSTYQSLFGYYLQSLPENATAPQCMVVLAVDLLGTPTSAILGSIGLDNLVLLHKCLGYRIKDIKQRGLNVV